MNSQEWKIDDFRDWYNSTQNLSRQVSPEKNDYVDAKHVFANNTLKQTKQISQLITASWLDDEQGSRIREILRLATADDTELKRLLTGQIPDLWADPIFTESEIDLYKFKINWDSYVGTLVEDQQAILLQNPPYFTVNLPCPSRPALGEANVTLEQLQEWVNSPIEKDENGLIKNPFPPYPYIPTSSA